MEFLEDSRTDSNGARPTQTEGMAEIELHAPAKINLTLAVLGKRSDGFHDIESIVMPVALYDRLLVRDGPNGGIDLSCSDPSLTEGPDNLVHRAARLLRQRAGQNRGACLELTKRIPVGAGLGGGSSDAAVTLIGLNELWRLGLTRSELAGIAAELGSDVPLFLTAGPSIIRGRGERVEPIRLDWSGRIVLVAPRFGMNTAEVYRRWRPTDRIPRPTDEVVRELQDGRKWDALLFNMLEEPAFSVEPRLAELHAKLAELGAPGARMSGSGSTMFALFDEPDEASACATRVRSDLDVDVHVLQTTTKCEHQ